MYIKKAMRHIEDSKKYNYTKGEDYAFFINRADVSFHKAIKFVKTNKKKAKILYLSGQYLISAATECYYYEEKTKFVGKALKNFNEAYKFDNSLAKDIRNMGDKVQAKVINRLIEKTRDSDMLAVLLENIFEKVPKVMESLSQMLCQELFDLYYN